jgi:hypothetical protein
MNAHDDDAGGGSGREDPGSGPGFYSLGANQSSASIFEDVEMAHDEVSRIMFVDASLQIPQLRCLPQLRCIYHSCSSYTTLWCIFRATVFTGRLC